MARCLGGLEGEDAEHVADPRQESGAEAEAGGGEPAGKAPARHAVEMAQDGRAGGRHPLAGDAVIQHLEALEQQRGGGRRHRQGAVIGVHPAATDRQRRHAPARRAGGVDQPGGGHDVGDRIGGADLVERHLLGADAVNAALRLGEQGEDAGGVVAHRLRQRRACNAGADVAPRRVLVDARGLDDEAGAGQHRVLVRRDPAGHPGDGGCRLGSAGAVVGKGVRQGGDEHVAGNTAERVEMQVPRSAQRAGLLRCRAIPIMRPLAG